MKAGGGGEGVKTTEKKNYWFRWFLGWEFLDLSTLVDGGKEGGGGGAQHCKWRASENPIYSLTNTLSPVWACLIIWWERFRGVQKENDHGPLSIQSSLLAAQRLYSKKNVVYGTLTWSWILLTLSHSQLRSQLSTLTTKWWEVDWGRCLLLVVYIFSVCYSNFQNNKQEKGEGEGAWKGWELTLCLWIDILWSMGNPMPELTLTPLRSWL